MKTRHPTKGQGVRREDCAEFSACLGVAAKKNWPSMNCGACSGPAVREEEYAAPPNKESVMPAAPTHDHTTPVTDLADIIGCGRGKIYKRAAELDIDLGERTPEQHAALVAALGESRRSGPKKTQKASAGERKAPKRERKAPRRERKAPRRERKPARPKTDGVLLHDAKIVTLLMALWPESLPREDYARAICLVRFLDSNVEVAA